MEETAPEVAAEETVTAPEPAPEVVTPAPETVTAPEPAPEVVPVSNINNAPRFG